MSPIDWIRRVRNPAGAYYRDPSLAPAEDPQRGTDAALAEWLAGLSPGKRRSLTRPMRSDVADLTRETKRIADELTERRMKLRAGLEPAPLKNSPGRMPR